MKELILAELAKLDFSVDNRHKRIEVVSKEFITEFGCGTLDLQFKFTPSLEEIESVDVYWFEMYDNSGDDIDTDLSDEEILEVFNF